MHFFLALLGLRVTKVKKKYTIIVISYKTPRLIFFKNEKDIAKFAEVDIGVLTVSEYDQESDNHTMQTNPQPPEEET